MNTLKGTSKFLEAVGDAVRTSCGGGGPEAATTTPPPAAPPPAGRFPGASRSRDAVEIPTGLIDRDEAQPRRHFDDDALGRLAESLRTRGVLQPIRVRPADEPGRYVIIMGERRWRAARLAGLASLPAVVHEGPLDDDQRLSIQLIENALREGLRPVEQAHAYRRLMAANGWNASRLAAELSLSPASVTRALSVLELPEAVQARVEAGELGPRVAYELSKLDDAASQAAMAERAVAERLTRDEVAAAVQGARPTGGSNKGRGAASRAVGGGKGAGRVVRKRVFKIPGGKVTIERARGVDAEALEAAIAAIRAACSAVGGEATTEGDPSPGAPGPADDPGIDAEQGRGVAA